jgi:hypothetical protein
VLGAPLIPWQAHAANLAGTLTPAGRLRYRVVVMIVPRRAGKTWLMLTYALALGRARPMSRSFYAAHRRETAAAMWRDSWFPRIELSPLHPRYVHIRRANGSESIGWSHNRSMLRLLPPDGDAMRSFEAHLAIVDEAREFTLDAGLEFEAAALPTMATGWGGQMWIVSNAGSMKSEWLARWRDLGRASVDNPASHICYLEYSAPDDADRDDPGVWRAAHPGLGHHVNLDALEADAETMPADTFAAEYLGIWPAVLIDRQLVDAWAAAGEAEPPPLTDPIIFALETTIERDRTVIVAAGNVAGRIGLELVDDRPHGEWVGPRLAELAARWHPAGLVYDAGGPAAALAHVFADTPINIVSMNTRDMAAAAGAFHDALLAGRYTHGSDPAMLDAVAAGRRRQAGGAWLFDRRHPAAVPLIAAAMAGWAHMDGLRRPPTVA